MTTFTLAFFAYLVPVFPLGYIWHLKAFSPVYERLEIYRPEPLIPLGLLSMLVQGIFFAWVYPKLFAPQSEHWLVDGVEFGALFGTLAWSFAVLPVAAKNRMTSVRDFVRIESAFTALQFAVVGPLIAFAYTF
ncbi:MAG: hypothetical protein R3A78_12340 [Polyangiales bacterium]|nr:hypothetical protein [Myxococcales bacterium]